MLNSTVWKELLLQQLAFLCFSANSHFDNLDFLHWAATPQPWELCHGEYEHCSARLPQIHCPNFYSNKGSVGKINTDAFNALSVCDYLPTCLQLVEQRLLNITVFTFFCLTLFTCGFESFTNHLHGRSTFRGWGFTKQKVLLSICGQLWNVVSLLRIRSLHRLWNCISLLFILGWKNEIWTTLPDTKEQ